MAESKEVFHAASKLAIIGGMTNINLLRIGALAALCLALACLFWCVGAKSFVKAIAVLFGAAVVLLALAVGAEIVHCHFDRQGCINL